MNPLCILTAAKKFGDATALIFENRTFSFTDLAHHSLSLSPFIKSLPRDKPFAFVAHNTLSSVLTMYTALSCQRPFIPVHPQSTSSVIDHIKRNSSIGAFPSTEKIETLLLEHQNAPSPKNASKHQDSFNATQDACVLFTSGTLGPPKGVVLTYKSFIESAKISETNLGWLPHDRWILSLPVSHIGGLSILTRCLLAGKCLILQPRFDKEQIFTAISKHNATMISVVPTTLHRLLNSDTQHLLRRLRAILLGGAAVPSALRTSWCNHQLKVFETYGMTETCSQVATSSQPVTNPTSTQKLLPLSGVKIEILNDAGKPLSQNQDGRICIEGKMLMRGYMNEPPCDGRFVTNDVGFVDETGALCILGRADDIIITGGENVHPHEIETALCTIDGVVNAVVFGVPDMEYGQLVAAVLFASPAATNDETIAHSIQQLLHGHRKPRKINVQNADHMPLLPNGKINRRFVIEKMFGNHQ